MRKYNKGLLSVGLLVLVASVLASVLVVKNLNFLVSYATKTNPNDIGSPKARIEAGGGNGGSGSSLTSQAGSYNRTGTAVPVDHGTVSTGGKVCGDIGDPSARQQCWLNAKTSGIYDGALCGNDILGAMDSNGRTCVMAGVGCNGMPNNCQVPHWTVCADPGGNGTPGCSQPGTHGGGGSNPTPVPTPTITPTPTPTPHEDKTLVCLPEKQTADVGETVGFSAHDQGTGQPVSGVTWTATGGNPASGTGSTFSTKYSSPGSYTVSVFKGGNYVFNLNCRVIVKQKSTHTPTPTCTPTITPYPTHSPKPSHSPSPTPPPCRFFCHPTPTPTVTPTPTEPPEPTPTMTATPTETPTVTPSPVPNASLKICKYSDSNDNGNIDNGEGTIGWTFFYSYQGNTYQTNSGWWNFWNSGCTTVNVPANQWITVSEQGQGGWVETAVYGNNNWSGNGSFNYISQSGSQEDVNFLNFNSGNPTPTPTGVPNFCGGTCGSNSNCQQGLFCYQGFCRNPNCQTDSSCSCAVTVVTQTPPPVVLGATAPPVLPKTGADDVSVIAGLLGVMGGGVALFRKFKLL